MKRSILHVVVVSHCMLWSAHGEDVESNLRDAIVKAVAGDIRPILAVFETIENVEHSEFAELYGRYQKRFISAEERFENDEPFITRLHNLYAAYWKTSLVDPDREEDASKRLTSALQALATSEGYRTSPVEWVFGPRIGKLETALTKAAQKKGYHVLMGRTWPLRELKIWRKEELGTYEVQLPGDRLTVQVVFAEDFVSKGWLGFATFNRSHSGGWCTDDVIYRVGAKPDGDSEWFRVSLLGHEGQHMSDQKRHGLRDGRILEYRAKLAELILADSSFWMLMDQFAAESKAPGSSPHSHASYKLVAHLIEQLTGEEVPGLLPPINFRDYSEHRIKAAAKHLLQRSSASL